MNDINHTQIVMNKVYYLGIAGLLSTTLYLLSLTLKNFFEKGSKKLLFLNEAKNWVEICKLFN